MSAYHVNNPATTIELALLMQVILTRSKDLEERVQLRIGTYVLRPKGEREREEHPDTVTTRYALMILTAGMIPEETVARMRISK